MLKILKSERVMLVPKNKLSETVVAVLITCQMPFLSPKQQCQRTEEWTRWHSHWKYKTMSSTQSDSHSVWHLSNAWICLQTFTQAYAQTTHREIDRSHQASYKHIKMFHLKTPIYFRTLYSYGENWPSFIRLVKLHEAMSHTEPHCSRAGWIDTQGSLIVCKCIAEILLIVCNTRLAKQWRDVVRTLWKDTQQR